MSQQLENQDFNKGDEGEISLVDIVQFLKESWKKLSAASLIGAALALGGWQVLGSYSAEYVLLNNSNSNSNSNSNINIPALDIVSLKTLQKSLPSLAAQILDDGKAPTSEHALYKVMQNNEWWQKNVTPI
jgi:hypothetical protein